MCALIGSYNIDKFKELYELNSYRGTLTSSFTTLDEDADMVLLGRWSSPLPSEILDDPYKQGDTGCYFLGHSQAPTTRGLNIHPAEDDDSGALLWHNGIIKEDTIKFMNKELETNYTWDTMLLLKWIEERGFESLSEIDGSFACILRATAGIIYVFRNILSPIFIDDNLNLSSTKFDGSRALPAHIVFEMDLRTKEFIDTGIRFDTCNNPYSI